MGALIYCVWYCAILYYFWSENTYNNVITTFRMVIIFHVGISPCSHEWMDISASLHKSCYCQGWHCCIVGMSVVGMSDQMQPSWEKVCKFEQQKVWSTHLCFGNQFFVLRRTSMPRTIEHGRQIMYKPSWSSLDLIWGSCVRISGGQDLVSCRADIKFSIILKYFSNNRPRLLLKLPAKRNNGWNNNSKLVLFDHEGKEYR
jgi:hypothetical protein